MAFYNTVNNATAIITVPHTIGDNVLHVNPIGIFGSGGFPIRVSCTRQSDNASAIYAIGSSGATTLNIIGVLENTADINLAVDDVCQADITAGALKDIHDAISAISTSGVPIVGTSGAVPIYNSIGLTESVDFIFDRTDTLLKTPMSDKGGQVYNVRSYGAKGNGVTDDSIAIQATINAAPKGSVVYFPDGRYKTSASFNINKDLTIRGTCGNLAYIDAFGGSWDAPGYQSGAVILSTLASGSLFNASAGDASYLRNNFEDLVIVGLGNGSRTTRAINYANYGTQTVSFGSCYGLRIANFYIAIETNAFENSHMLDCFFIACAYGLMLNLNTNANVFGNINISACPTGVYFNGAGVNLFQGGAIQGSEVGIYLGVGSEENNIKSVYFESNAAYGKSIVANSDANVIDNCHFGSSGVTVEIAGNTNKIISGKYVQALNIGPSANSTVVIGASNPIVDSGSNTVYLNGVGVVTGTVQSPASLDLHGTTFTRVRSNNNQSSFVASDLGATLTAAAAGGLGITTGANTINFFSTLFYPVTDNSISLGISSNRYKKLSVMDVEVYGNIYGNGSGITNISASITPGTSGTIPFYSNTGLTEDTNFSYNKTSKILNIYGINSSGVNANNYFAGKVGIGAIPSGSMLQVNANAATTKGLTIQGFSGQSANLLEVNSTTGLLASISSAGGGLFNGGIRSPRGTTGQNVEAFGVNALVATTTGGNNAAIGSFALASLTTGNNNAACGHNALGASVSGGANTAIGYNADGGKTVGDSCTALGGSTVTGAFTRSTAIGNSATCTADNQVMLGTTAEIVLAPNKLGINEKTPGAHLQITISSASTKGLVVKSASGQVETMIELQSSTGSVITSANASGIITPSITTTSGGIRAISSGTHFTACDINGTPHVNIQRDTISSPQLTLQDNSTASRIVLDPTTLTVVAPAAGGLGLNSGLASVNFFSSFFFPGSDLGVSLGTVSNRFSNIYGGNFIGGGASISGISPANITPGTSGAIPIYSNTGLTEDANFSYNKTSKILNVSSINTTGVAVNNYFAGNVGIGKVPTKPLDINGVMQASGIHTGIRLTTNNTTLTNNDDSILVDASGALLLVVVTLTDATSVGDGRIYTIKKIDSSINTVAISGVSGQTIDGLPVQLLTTQWQHYTIKSYSGNWYIF